ncbi:hypothetical protein BH23GEM6_BH23GEM6_07490 [soil metagenome]
MKRVLVMLFALAPLALAACGSPQVVVETSFAEEGATERRILSDLPVRLLPYDRDAIFDSLEAAYPEPEPSIPPEVLQQQQLVQRAQTEWRQAEQRWTTVRDSLRTLSNTLQSLQQQGLRATPQYRQAFERFGSLDDEEDRVKANMDAAFARFDQLQRTALAQADSIRVAREAWAERAFADFDRVVADRLRRMNREEVVDTTNASGISRMRVPDGQWWVYSRYAMPYQELYWNLPVQVSGDSTRVVLNEQNAQLRPVL